MGFSSRPEQSQIPENYCHLFLAKVIGSFPTDGIRCFPTGCKPSATIRASTSKRRFGYGDDGSRGGCYSHRRRTLPKTARDTFRSCFRVEIASAGGVSLYETPDIPASNAGLNGTPFLRHGSKPTSGSGFLPSRGKNLRKKLRRFSGNGSPNRGTAAEGGPTAACFGVPTGIGAAPRSGCQLAPEWRPAGHRSRSAAKRG